MAMLVEQINPTGWARTYLITCTRNSMAALIDPIHANIERDLALIEERGLTLKYVIGTHTHADHISGGWELAAKAGCDFLMLEGALTHGVTRTVTSGSDLSMGGVEFNFYASPGHTPDSMCIEIPGFLFTGDFLFNGNGGTGRDDLPGGSLEVHWKALAVLQSINENTVIMSGHEAPGTEPQTLLWNREHNPVLQMSSFEEYKSWQESEWERLGSVSAIGVALPANLTGEVPQ
jgi:glyoxylase-like metal-dependent hydrolase (beta-lactamase superfamily II)